MPFPRSTASRPAPSQIVCYRGPWEQASWQHLLIRGLELMRGVRRVEVDLGSVTGT
jgi:hypothetical protein